MARVHVRCWQETYRGLMPDAVLGTARFDDGVREIRMVRSVQHGGTGRSHCL